MAFGGAGGSDPFIEDWDSLGLGSGDSDSEQTESQTAGSYLPLGSLTTAGASLTSATARNATSNIPTGTTGDSISPTEESEYLTEKQIPDNSAGVLATRIRIKNPISLQRIHVQLPTNKLIIHLPDFNIVKNSEVFRVYDSSSFPYSQITLSSSTPLWKGNRVPFINGCREFENSPYLIKKEAVLSLLFRDPTTDKGTFYLNGPVAPVGTGSVLFSSSFNTIGGAAIVGSTFTREVFTYSELSEVGDYFIDRDESSLSYRCVYFVMPVGIDEIPISCMVTYPVINPDYVIKNDYSIDYKLGKIYLEQLLPSSWRVFIDYNYTDYKAEYRIARPILNYTVNAKDKTITISSGEIKIRDSIPTAENLTYEVSYDYVKRSAEDLLQLKNYFSPILKDYKIKIITKGNRF